MLYTFSVWNMPCVVFLQKTDGAQTLDQLRLCGCSVSNWNFLRFGFCFTFFWSTSVIFIINYTIVWNTCVKYFNRKMWAISQFPFSSLLLIPIRINMKYIAIEMVLEIANIKPAKKDPSSKIYHDCVSECECKNLFKL